MRSLLLAIAFANISPGSASGISADLDKTSSASLIPRVEVVKTQPYTPDRQYDAAYDASVQLTVTILNNRSSLLYGYVTAIDPSTGAYMNLYRENTQAPYIWKPKPNGTSAIPKYFTSGLGQYEIQLPAGRNSTVFLPGYATSGRVYIASDHLQFGTTAGGPAEGLVEPSVSNPSLPEHNIAYQFLEFTYLKDSFYADISNMDFISLPLGMTVVSSNATSTVPGLVANATELICEALEKQTARDAFSWAKFCVRHESTNDLLRVLSPTQYLALYPSDNLSTYFDPYVDQVWNKYKNVDLSFNTQDSDPVHGGGKKVTNGSVVNCRVAHGRPKGEPLLTCDGEGGQIKFSKPTTTQIFGCTQGDASTFTIANSNDKTQSEIVPRLCAAFHRSTLLLPGGNIQPPANFTADQYYKANITDHFARIVHQYEQEGMGYAFAYDDTNSGEGPDNASTNAAGVIMMSNPEMLFITVGN